MPITGLDEVSHKVLNSLNNGTKVKDIPSLFPVSLDQAKRLSRYHNLLEQATTHLTQEAVDKLRKLGIKALYLSSLFKDEDWDGLTEILSSINERTRRDEFPLLIQALQEKRERIKHFQLETESKLNRLARREKELLQLEESIKETTEKIKQEQKFLKKYPAKVQRFLIKHLGIYNDKLVLARRLDSLWQKSLKKSNVLEFADFVYYVKDLDALAEDYLKRINRKTPLGTEWDYEKEDYRNRNGEYATPYSPEYRLPSGLAVDLRSSLEAVEEQMQEIRAEQETIQKEMKQLRKTSPKSFIEAIEATNTLSAHELKLHGEMQDKALKWLYNKGFIVASEVTLPNGKRADVIGYDENGHIVIVEVKVSTADFRQDEKWQTYLEYCDEFYFLLKPEIRPLFYRKQDYTGVGLLEETKKNVKIRRDHLLKHQPKERNKLQFSISKALSKKYVFGY
ncbi:putative nucleic acid-binding Zn-ribbon protein [Bradyrhizobium japonicum]